MSIHVRETAKGRRYDVKLRSSDGRQHAKTFTTKKAAIDYEARQLAARADGTFIAPRATSTKVFELAERYLAGGAKRDSTRSRDRSAVKNHIVPGLGPDRPIGGFSRADCQGLVDSWVRSGKAPRSVIRLAAVMRAMFQYAVDAELILRNPAARMRLPTPSPVVRPQLTSEQLEHLAEALGGDQGTFMWCGAVLGLRWAEVAGLTVSAIDDLANTVTVSSQLDRDGELRPPKTKGSIRTLAAPKWLVGELVALSAHRGSSDALIFQSTDGCPLDYTNWRQRVWVPATSDAGLLGLRFHDLRSMAATALVAAGVDLRTAMHRLGHTTPAMTLAVYARVADDADRAAAQAVGERLAPHRYT